MAQSTAALVDHTSLPRAQRRLAEEESQIQVEIVAFENFLDRLDEIPGHSYRADGGTLHTRFHSQSHSSHPPQEAVQTAYRETILELAHWSEMYGEASVLESMKNEFGANVAAGLTGGAATWSPLLWKQLRSASEEAIETRQEMHQVVTEELSQLDELARTLAELGDELAAIERGQYSFTDRSDRLESSKEQLAALTDKQQRYLHRRNIPNEELFSSFVYGDFETAYPGLAALVTSRELLDKIEFRHWAGLI